MVQFGHLKIRFCRFRTKGRNANISGSKWPIDFFGMLVEAFSLSSVPQYLRFYSRVDILSARWKAPSVCLLVTKCTYNCQNHRVIILITRWIRAITLPTFCRLVLPPKIKTSKWGLDPPFTIKSSKWGLDIISPIKASFWGLDTALVSYPPFEGMNSEIKATLCRFDLRLGFVGWIYFSTIYPKSRFCTKWHKRLYFQGVWGIFEGFSRNVKKGNCKFEPQKCNSVFRVIYCVKVCFLTESFLWIQRCSIWGLILYLINLDQIGIPGMSRGISTGDNNTIFFRQSKFLWGNLLCCIQN